MVYNSADVVVPMAGSHDVVYAAASYTLPTGVDALFLEGTPPRAGNSDAAGDGLYAANPGQVATLTGNSPNDAFVVYNSSDVVVPEAASHDVVYSAVGYTLPTGVDILFLEGSASQGVGNGDAAGDALYAANPGGWRLWLATARTTPSWSTIRPTWWRRKPAATTPSTRP